MAAAKQVPVPITSTEEKPADPDNLNEQMKSLINSSQDAVNVGHLSDATCRSRYLCPDGDFNTACPPNALKTHTANSGGNNNIADTMVKYPPHVNAEGFEVGSHSIHSGNQSLVCHSYEYSPQMPYGTYYPVSKKPPFVRGDGSCPAYEFPIPDRPYYEQPNSSNISYIPDHRGDCKLSPGLGSFGRGNVYSGKSGGLSFLQQGLGCGEPWSDWPNLSTGQCSLSRLPSSATSSQQMASLRWSGNNVRMASQHEGPYYGFGCCSSSYCRCHPHIRNTRGSSFGSFPLSSFGQSWLTTHKERRDALSLCSSGALETLGEQNRGPRASKPKSTFSTTNNMKNEAVQSGCYNRPDFVTEYKDARFFIVKSYSEDNVHKSIKYSVWTSTPSGNQKLDAAYRKTMEKEGNCPIFLLFSANASAQFCGVAEMVGAVDFGKSVDYWQQDKWTGQFPVKWHIVKDVPNSQFRHIILENNDNKPVTNSRDTQEVELTKGIEMLKIFKNYESNSSILDDFDFYENRQKVMQERKAREKASLVAQVVGGTDYQNPVLSNDLIKQMSKSFAQVVVLSENEKERLGVGKCADDRGKA